MIRALFLLTSLTVEETLVNVKLCCSVFFQTCSSHQTHTCTKRSWSSWPIFSLVVQIKYSWPHWPDSFCWKNTTGVTGDDKVHLWEVGICVKSRNCCPILLQLSTYSISQEGSQCHKKSIKSTSNYPGNWQWNWKSLWSLGTAHPPTSPNQDSCCVTTTLFLWWWKCCPRHCLLE